MSNGNLILVLGDQLSLDIASLKVGKHGIIGIPLQCQTLVLKSPCQSIIAMGMVGTEWT